ncbi:MAG: M23 family metallopeptidase [Bacteroidetes bacterium]|nr:M23 family metallopeptidase [Bacteroidota bacterium]
MYFQKCSSRLLLLARHLMMVVLFLGAKPMQAQWDKNYFSAPLDIKLRLAGNFAEIRGSHFHSGLDFKTDSVEGKNVMATADGFIARIKVSAVGFGNAIYIQHPNGLTTVYGHLRRFNDFIDSLVYFEQSKKMKFELDWHPEDDLYKISKGEVIGYSGNTGGSAGPHLHFEVRNTDTEKTINPRLFNFAIEDTIAPILSKLVVYDGNDVVDELKPRKDDVGYYIRDTLSVTPRPGFGFEALDKMNNTYNSMGIYNVLFTIDGNIVWQNRLDSFDFDETRYVNAYIDYSRDYFRNITTERLYRMPNNGFSTMKNNSTERKVYLNSKEVHKAVLVLEDEAGNKSALTFYFVANNLKIKKVAMQGSKTFLPYSKPYKFQNGEVIFQLNENALFDNIYLQYHKSKREKKLVSPVYHFNDASYPLNKSASISIRVNGISKQLQPKLVMMRMNKDGSFAYIGGTLNKNYFVATSKTLGAFALAVDTVAPTIKQLFKSDSIISNNDTLKFRYAEDISGIDNYSLTNNEAKLIVKHDAKYKMLYIEAKYLIAAENKLTLRVEDNRNNVSTYTVTVYRRQE